MCEVGAAAPRGSFPDGSTAVITLHGGKVNALTGSTVAQLRERLAGIEIRR